MKGVAIENLRLTRRIPSGVAVEGYLRREWELEHLDLVPTLDPLRAVPEVALASRGGGRPC